MKASNMTELTTFRDITRQMLKNRPLSVSTAEIAKEINVSPAWVNAFAKGKIPNPGVNTVETLNAFLKKINKKAR
jgi:predicted transcriptional regulator